MLSYSQVLIPIIVTKHNIITLTHSSSSSVLLTKSYTVHTDNLLQIKPGETDCPSKIMS